jgi:hypothetical protein
MPTQVDTVLVEAVVADVAAEAEAVVDIVVEVGVAMTVDMVVATANGSPIRPSASVVVLSFSVTRRCEYRFRVFHNTLF